MRADGGNRLISDSDKTLLERVDLFRERACALREGLRERVLHRLRASINLFLRSVLRMIHQCAQTRLGAVESGFGRCDLLGDACDKSLGCVGQRTVERAAMIGDGLMDRCAGF